MENELAKPRNYFPVKDWELLPIEVFKLVLDEQEKAFSLYSAETQSITDKSIRLLTAFVTFMAAAAIYIFSKHGNVIANAVIGAACIFVAIRVFWVFKGHPVHYAGAFPNDVLTSDFDSSTLSDDEKTRLVYRNIIQIYGFKITEMSVINAERVSKYDTCLALVILAIGGVSCYLGAIW